MQWQRVASLVVLTLIVACGRPASDAGSTRSETIRIGFLVKQPEEPWFQNQWRFAQQAADAYSARLVKIGATDAERVLAAIDNLAAQGVQGFIICTPDVRLGPAIVAKAKAHGMHVTSVDDQFVGPDGAFMDVPHIPPFYQYVASGAILRAAVLLDRIRQREASCSSVSRS